MEEVKFVEYMTCKDCIKKFKLYTIDYKKQVLAERSRLKRCIGCTTLREVSEAVKNDKLGDKKSTNIKTKSSNI